MLTNQEDIKKWLAKFNLKNFFLNHDLSVSFLSDFIINNTDITHIPFKISSVEGVFNLESNQINNLNGFPKYVGGSIILDNNNIISLEGFPNNCEHSISLNNNKINSFKGIPSNINGSLYIINNPISSFEFSPNRIAGTFHINSDLITTLQFFPRIFGNSLIQCDNLVNFQHNILLINQKIIFDITNFNNKTGFNLICSIKEGKEYCALTLEELNQVILYINISKSLPNNHIYRNKI